MVCSSFDQIDDLLVYIQSGQVIPVIGPELVQVELDDERLALETWLARQLVREFGLDAAALPAKYELSDVAWQFLLRNPRSRPDLFLSYAAEDRATVVRLKEGLEKAGIQVWFDQGRLQAGEAFNEVIKERIYGSTLFVPCISAATCQAYRENTSRYFKQEWGEALMVFRPYPFLAPWCSTPSCLIPVSLRIERRAVFPAPGCGAL